MFYSCFQTADEGTTQESVSYDGVGVFRKNDNMTHPLRLPDPPEEIHTKFYLYEGKDKMTLVAHWDSALKIDDEGKLKNLKQITVLIHGFIQTSHVEWTLETGAALLEKVSLIDFCTSLQWFLCEWAPSIYMIYLLALSTRETRQEH